MGFRLVTPDESIDYDDGHKAVMAYVRRVTAKQRSVLFQTFDDALPNRSLQGPVLIASYPQGPEQEAIVRRAERAVRIEAAVDSLHAQSVGNTVRRDRDNAGTEHDDRL
jgi:hypothetical protein